MISKEEFTEWIDEYSDQLYGFALKRTADPALSEDLVQDSLISAYQNRKTFQDRGNPISWLFAILRNKIIDHYRSQSRKPSSSLDDIENKDALFFNEKGQWRKESAPRDWGESGHDLLEREEFLKVFKDCRSLLSHNQKMAFQFKYFEGWSAKKICKELNITPSNYWVLIHRAKLFLRSCLEKNWMNK